jgi:hypothetical protein
MGKILGKNPFLRVRKHAESISKDPQELNRQWWENMPMTYVDWELNERHLSDHEAFEEVQKKFLKNNPWVAENIDFSKFKNQSVLEIAFEFGAASCLFAEA